MINKKLIDEYMNNTVYFSTPDDERQARYNRRAELLFQMSAEDVEYLLQDAINRGSIIQYKIKLNHILLDKKKEEEKLNKGKEEWKRSLQKTVILNLQSKVTL